jgi:hypothetical protein
MSLKSCGIESRPQAPAFDGKWLMGLVLVLVLSSLVSACDARSQGLEQTATRAEEAFSDQFGLDRLDNQIDIDLTEEDGSVVNGGQIQLLVANRSKKAVWFPPGYGSRLFIRESSEGEWIEIKNQVTYVGDGDLLEPRGSGSGNWAGVVTVSAGDCPLDEVGILRIVVTGRVASDGIISDIHTSSFIDISLTR